MTAEKLKVFLCHSSRDKARVRELFRRLRADGADPWLDEENLSGGSDWELEIRKAVRDTHVVLVCLTAEAVSKRGFVQKEIKYALDITDEQPEGAIFLIPLRFEQCDVPERLRAKQWVDYFEPDGHDRLLLALARRADELQLTKPVTSNQTPARSSFDRVVTRPAIGLPSRMLPEGISVYAAALLRSPPLRELKRVPDIPFIDEVYAGLNVTKFNKALYVYQRTIQYVRSLKSGTTSGVAHLLGERELQSLYAAALLREAGHYPFANIFGEMLPLGDAALPDNRVVQLLVANENTWAGEWRYQLMEILVTTMGVSPQDVAAIITGRESIASELDAERVPLFHNILSGPLGSAAVTDVVTYSNALGLSSLVDEQHLLSGIRYDALRGLGVTRRALATAESLLLAQLQLAEILYWHHELRSFHSMLLETLRIAVQNQNYNEVIRRVTMTESEAECLDELGMMVSQDTVQDLLTPLRRGEPYPCLISVSPESPAVTGSKFVEHGDLYGRMYLLSLEASRYGTAHRWDACLERIRNGVRNFLGIDVPDHHVLVDVPRRSQPRSSRFGWWYDSYEEEGPWVYEDDESVHEHWRVDWRSQSWKALQEQLRTPPIRVFVAPWIRMSEQFEKLQGEMQHLLWDVIDSALREGLVR